MPRDYPHLRSLVFDRPLAIAPQKLNDILHVLGPRLNLSNMPPQAQSGEPTGALDEVEVEGNLFVVPVHGTLVNRWAHMDAMSGLASYEILRRYIEIGLTDRTYDAIVLDIESFGGEAAGMTDLSNFIREADEQKPIYSVVNSNALSAGYGLASAARSIITINDGLLGSVGVIAAHRDESKHNEQEGFDWTLVTAGERKADFSPTKPLSKEALAWLEALVAKSYDEFVVQLEYHDDGAWLPVARFDHDAFGPAYRNVVLVGLRLDVYGSNGEQIEKRKLWRPQPASEAMGAGEE